MKIPYDEQAEARLIGAMMINPNAVLEVVTAVSSGDLYGPKARLVFDAVLARIRNQQPIEPLAVTHDLAAAGHPRLAEYIQECISDTPIAYNVGYYVQVINEHSRRRAILEIAIKGGQRAEDPYTDPDEIGAAMGEQLREAMAPRGGDVIPLHTSMTEYVDQVAGGAEVYPTGLKDLDHLLGGGLRAPQLIIVAGRPGMGKSIFGVEMIRCLGIPRNVPTLLFSLEMSHLEVTQRVLSAMTKTPLETLRAGLPPDDIHWPLLVSSAEAVREAPVAVADRLFTLDRVVAAAHRFRHRHGPSGLIVVDYLQLITVSGQRRYDNRTAEVSEISRALKRLSMDIGWPVIAMSQLNRNSEGRADRRPQLSDLRESGSIEQDADVVILLHRPSYYDEQDRPGEIDFIVAKHRQGRTGTVTAAEHFRICRMANFTASSTPATPPGTQQGWD